MSETVATPAEGASSNESEAVKPAPQIAEAGVLLKKAQTWDELLKPEPETPAVEAAPDPKAFEGFTVDETTSELKRPDGTAADEKEVEKYNAAQSQPTGPIVITLKARDGSEREIEAADEETAEILRANAKDGLRGEEYRRKMQAVEEHLAERRVFEQVMESNPEALILQHLPADKQLALAKALIAKHWDELAPDLVKYDGDASKRAEDAANADRRSRESQGTLTQTRERERYIVSMEQATRSLIPDHIDDATAEQFLADAGLDLGRAVTQMGRPVEPQDVKSVLAKRLALYGFDKPAPGVNGADADARSAEPPKRPIARAVNKPGAGVTAQPTAGVKASPDAGAAVRRAVTAQRVAASVPPPGAGAATLRIPMVPPGTTIEQASQALRKLGSWSDAHRG